MDHFYHTIGEDWFDYQSLYSRMVERFDSGRFVEVGSWKGRSASFMGVEILNSRKPIRLFCVDTWKGSLEHQDMDCIINGTLYEQFIHNTSPVGSVLTPLRMESIEASKTFPDGSLEFVFLDAAHDYTNVINDIT